MQQNQTKQTGTSDSLFGMALAQTFMGVAFGADVSAAWEAGEITSAVREDRIKTTTRTNDGNGFKLGVKHGLTDVFAGLQGAANSNHTISELEHSTFKQFFSPPAPKGMAA